MTPGELSKRLTNESFAAIRAHPRFRAAVLRATGESIAHFQDQDPNYQWITKDIGRAAICVTALSLHMVGLLTAQALTAACLKNDISSAGRVQQVIRRCQDMGELIVEEGPGLWTRRPMRMGERLIRILRERAVIDLKATLCLAPELAGAVDLAESEDGFLHYTIALSMITDLRRDLFAFREGSPVNYLLDREAGMLIAFDFVSTQPLEQPRLLQEAPISRYALARRYGVSRAHINKILAESGHMECVGDDRVVFSEALSLAIERHFALVFQLNQCAAQALLSNWRFGERAASR
jgi:hypothetical protein